MHLKELWNSLNNIKEWKENLFLALNDINKGCDTTKKLVSVAMWNKMYTISYLNQNAVFINEE